MALGKNIKFHRERLGLTLLQLSDASGVDVGTISALEVRDSRRSQYGSAIAAAMGMTFEQLAGSDLPQDQPPPLAPSKADPVSSIDGLMTALSPMLADAPDALKSAVLALVTKYNNDPAEGERIAEAIKLLIGTDKPKP